MQNPDSSGDDAPAGFTETLPCNFSSDDAQVADRKSQIVIVGDGDAGQIVIQPDFMQPTIDDGDNDAGHADVLAYRQSGVLIHVWEGKRAMTMLTTCLEVPP